MQWEQKAMSINAKIAIVMLMPHDVECAQSICHTKCCPGVVLVEKQ